VRIPFREKIAKGVTIFDGAIGTRIYEQGVFINTCYDELNVMKPEMVRSIHSGYIESGAEVIETNTFGANRLKLRAYGLGEQAVRINERGVEIARDVAGDDIYVAGSIGPLGTYIEPVGKLSAAEAVDVYTEQIEALARSGVDLIIFETFSVLAELELAAKTARKVTGLPVIASFTCGEKGHTQTGIAAEKMAAVLAGLDAVDVIGLNCGVGPNTMLTLLEAIVPYAGGKPILVMPNAGYPRTVGGRYLYMASPEYYAEYCKRFVEKGASLIGGCCGIHDQHIKEMARALKAVDFSRKRIEVKPVIEAPELAEPLPLEKRSRLGRKLAGKEWVTSVEITPPRGWHLEKTIEKAKRCRDAGVDAINLPDGPRASSRLSPMIAALEIEQKAGIETVLHYCCRDRNLIGMQADFLGAQAAGLRNILIITGDPPKLGSYPDATGVFDVDSIGLTRLANLLNHGLDLGMLKIDPPTSFVLGVGVNPYALDLDTEIERLEKKVEAGADFVITQPVFAVEAFSHFLDRIGHLEVPVIAGIWPFPSLKNAEFMRNEVPGVIVPDDVLERMRSCGTKEEARAEGIKIAGEIVKEIVPLVNGIQVSAPLGNISIALEVIEGK